MHKSNKVMNFGSEVQNQKSIFSYASKNSFFAYFSYSLVILIIGLLILSENLKLFQISIKYNLECNRKTNGSCFHYNRSSNCDCEIDFEIKKRVNGPIFFYYKLKNFYQNHRYFTRSYDPFQLFGLVQNMESLSKYCNPFIGKHNRVFAPCGIKANAMFNDTFSLFYKNGSNLTLVHWSKRKLCRNYEINRRYRNPPGFYQNPQHAFSMTLKPPNWSKDIYMMDLSNPHNNGFKNEDLIIWMISAATPTFKKLYAIMFKDGENFLRAGKYVLRINNVYPVSSFGGSKYFVISTTSFVGGLNYFLPGFCIFFSFCIFISVLWFTIVRFLNNK